MYRKKKQLLPISRFAYGHNDHGAQSKEVQPGNFTYLYKISEDMNMGIYKGRSWSGYEVKDNIFVEDYKNGNDSDFSYDD